MLLKAMIYKQLTVFCMRSLLGMEGKFIGFSLLPTLNFLFILTDTLIFMFMLTFIQMAKRLKIEYNASNTTKRGEGDTNCSRTMLFIFLTIQSSFDHKYVRVYP